jgi:phosphoribosyl 1,2-cyclic phosphate phosphodiesterase
MKILLLGTAAAEAWPCPFCSCDACTRARKLGGKDIRGRSGTVIDDCVKVDFGPDTFAQIQGLGLDLTGLTTMIFTHSHEDHFSPYELLYRESNHVVIGGLPIMNVYGSEGVMARLNSAYTGRTYNTFTLEPPLRPFVEVTTPDGTKILPLPADHTGDPFLLRVTRNGSSVLHGHDTGPIPEETISALAGSNLDVVLLDCTYGGGPTYGSHMGIKDVLDSVERLNKVGALHDKTQIIATHFSHNGGLLHEELEARFSPHGIHVAFDGQVLNT